MVVCGTALSDPDVELGCVAQRRSGLKTMARRRRRPSKYRFLKAVFASAIPLMILVAVHQAKVVACGMASRASAQAPPCTFALPSIIIAGLWAAVVICLLAGAYQWYRDFVKLDYLNDPDER